MPFTTSDLEPDGWVQGTTFHAFNVARDGVPVGRVHVNLLTLQTQSVDPAEWVANKLNETEQHSGAAKLDDALRSTLELG